MLRVELINEIQVKELIELWKRNYENQICDALGYLAVNITDQNLSIEWVEPSIE